MIGEIIGAIFEGIVLAIASSSWRAFLWFLLIVLVLFLSIILIVSMGKA